MTMEISVAFFLLLFFVAVRSQREMGFISIDCGASKPYYRDTDTDISYVSDASSVHSGTNHNISARFQYPNDPTLPLPLSDLRAFPYGTKNCYTLIPEHVGTLNLVRASFYYADYDGLDNPPEFDLFLGVNFWTTVKFRAVNETFTTEIIDVVLGNAVHVCLVDKNLGVPFISALELRPLNGSVYRSEFGVNASMVLVERFDLGDNKSISRFADDPYDRIWSSFDSRNWDSIRTSSVVDTFQNGFRVPQEVIQTASKLNNGGNSMELEWNSSDSKSMFSVSMHFAEVEELAKNQTRELEVSWNGNPLFGPFSPPYLKAVTLSNFRSLVGKNHQISIRRTENSMLPPILNAVEIYLVRLKGEFPTYGDDANAIEDVKRTYRIAGSWSGDPCGPRNLSWPGLKCTHNASIPPRIVSLNLTSRNLRGIIASSISKLSSLESLDLSNNNLTGSVPAFLKDLKSLKKLNLRRNQLFGVVPSELLVRSNQGLLELSVDTRNLCKSGSCQKKKKTSVVVPIVASLASAIVLFTVLIFVWKRRRNRKSEAKKMGSHVVIKKSQYRYEEVVKITENFKTKIGKGGFGPVYHGYLNDKTQVAVKMLSPSSSQGPKEFQTEAELLLRIHHRNLASFVGYCDDGNKLALIYEYMPNGNLNEYLSGKSAQLGWETRLRIAVDAAQGLEYLHNGCKPAIVHRDVKTSNILLGEKLDAKIADFGLSKVFAGDNETHVETAVMGTAGYLDPEYYRTQKLTEKSDVFSFGVVLLELITGQPAIIRGDETVHIIQWTRSELEEGDIRNIVDPILGVNFDWESVSRALQVAMDCTATSSEPRPSMGSVLQELRLCLETESTRDPLITSEIPVRNYKYNSDQCTTPLVLSSSIYTDSMNMETESITNPLAR